MTVIDAVKLAYPAALRVVRSEAATLLLPAIVLAVVDAAGFAPAARPGPGWWSAHGLPDLLYIAKDVALLLVEAATLRFLLGDRRGIRLLAVTVPLLGVLLLEELSRAPDMLVLRAVLSAAASTLGWLGLTLGRWPTVAIKLATLLLLLVFWNRAIQLLCVSLCLGDGQLGILDGWRAMRGHGWSSWAASLPCLFPLFVPHYGLSLLLDSRPAAPVLVPLVVADSVAEALIAVVMSAFRAALYRWLVLERAMTAVLPVGGPATAPRPPPATRAAGGSP